MFCPKCSQQQPSERMRFCSRCGFLLEDVALLVENDGLIPRLAQKPQTKPGAGSRGRILKESALLTLASWLVTFIATAFWDWGGPLEIVAKLATMIFFVVGLIGLLRFVYAFLFVKGEVAPTEQPTLSAAQRRASLPSPQQVPLSDYPRSNTREMAPRVSVTEQTTRLLDKE